MVGDNDGEVVGMSVGFEKVGLVVGIGVLHMTFAPSHMGTSPPLQRKFVHGSQTTTGSHGSTPSQE